MLHVPHVVARGGVKCLLPDAVSEIRCRRAKGIPGNNNHVTRSEPPVLSLVRGISRGKADLAVRREPKSKIFITDQNNPDTACT